MKPAVDEMFPEGAGPYVDLDEAGGSTGLLMDLAANEKAVHSDFFNGLHDCRKGTFGSAQDDLEKGLLKSKGAVDRRSLKTFYGGLLAPTQHGSSL
ncbi:COP9 signalosome complex subunit 9 isoform X1 [Colossoma macropomum]|uniref:COP9 signalosome complex subunit 9 isoform X1 n=1 Tax=Colossoma macropomum TaxID=42526 RepID=UPI0018650FC5|nr:COP9 signalosome complex subunit 9 isoform X1 [Colossoma macropomum]